MENGKHLPNKTICKKRFSISFNKDDKFFAKLKTRKIRSGGYLSKSD